MSELLDFLHSRRKILETYKPNKSEKTDQHDKNKNRRTHANNENHNSHSYATQYKAFCHLCKGSHYTQYCEKLMNSSVSERINIIKKANLCFNCLKSNHRVEDCKSDHCKNCSKKYHTILQLETDQIDKNSKANFMNTSSKPSQSTHLNTFSSKNAQGESLFTTAVVEIMDRDGTYSECRFLLDSCSQPHLLMTRMISKLELPRQNINIPLGAVNSLSSCIKHMTRTEVKSRLNNFSLNLEFLIVDEINELLPSRPLDKLDFNIPNNIKLADPSFNRPGPVDGIIGAEFFLQLLKQGQIKIPGQNIVLQNTVFGWIIAGKTLVGSPIRQTFCHLITMLLNSQLERFWTLENCPEKEILSVEEKECETNYEKHTTRDVVNGRYCVRLPFRENVGEIGESYSNALKRLYSLERTFIKKPEIKNLYIKNLRIYHTNGYMSEVRAYSKKEGYYLPHHAVIKNNSLTTQLRVVFDGSAKHLQAYP
ncbi:uncharacterized protein LOC117169821 [Belonocnema kinseyi]|uniref:uncharacterized protein LOC117169821 n=1 Tax=Belonocnema kinseyi TaxID=2817044 RepID=UPI00143DF047|nr:uncharacterized protein LOC117169821 [Belonocnema kinseyi]